MLNEKKRSGDETYFRTDRERNTLRLDAADWRKCIIGRVPPLLQNNHAALPARKQILKSTPRTLFRRVKTYLRNIIIHKE